MEGPGRELGRSPAAEGFPGNGGEHPDQIGSVCGELGRGGAGNGAEPGGPQSRLGTLPLPSVGEGPGAAPGLPCRAGR